MTLPAAVVDAVPIAFDELDLDPALAEGVRDRGFAATTPVQSAVFPLVASGRDLIASAETGSGKTAAYLLPVLDRLLKEPRPPGGAGPRGTRVLVLGPTRELVVQIEDDLQGFVYHTGLTSAAVFGGTPMSPHVARPSRPASTSSSRPPDASSTTCGAASPGSTASTP